MKKVERTAVLGDGAWGTATALVLARKGIEVALWGAFPDYVAEVDRTRENTRFLPGVPIPPSIRYTDDIDDAVAGADLVVQAVPTQHLRRVMERLSRPRPRVVFVSLSKGIEQKTFQRPEEILRAVLGPRTPVAVLSGPSHAEEVARGLPTSVVVAARNPSVAQVVQTALSDEAFRVYTSTDVTGVSLGGALKNVVAIAAGISDGLGFGDNTKAALITRGSVEVARLGTRLGGRAYTFAGLSGIGDLIVTCASRHGRNRAFGEAVGQGGKPEDILASSPKVVEGVWTSRSVAGLSSRLGVEMPISQEVYRVLFKKRDVRKAVVSLMTRSLKPE
jgi:glycerol-3-phosphate dehydrogenase (NAD(P)+)